MVARYHPCWDNQIDEDRATGLVRICAAECRVILKSTVTLKWLLAGALALGVCAPVLALDPGKSLSQYSRTNWTQEHGLPQDTIRAITQTSDGYLWLGTPTGLLRFDGSHFLPWSAINDKEPLPNGPVHAIVSAHDGSLWVGLGGGGGIVRIAKGHLTRFGPDQGAPPGVTAMLEDRQGVVWAAARRGLFRFAGGKWSTVGTGEGYPGTEAFSVFEDRSGGVWVGSSAGVYCQKPQYVSTTAISYAVSRPPERS